MDEGFGCPSRRVGVFHVTFRKYKRRARDFGWLERSRRASHLPRMSNAWKHRCGPRIRRAFKKWSWICRELQQTASKKPVKCAEKVLGCIMSCQKNLWAASNIQNMCSAMWWRDLRMRVLPAPDLPMKCMRRGRRCGGEVKELRVRKGRCFFSKRIVCFMIVARFHIFRVSVERRMRTRVLSVWFAVWMSRLNVGCVISLSVPCLELCFLSPRMRARSLVFP